MSEAWSDQLLPPAQTRLEAALGRSMPPDGLTPEIIATLWNPAIIPAPLLPWLAWALSVDEWDEAWAESAKRDAIAQSIPIHRRKGTVWAVKSAVALTGYRAEIKEWWQQSPLGVPHTFSIDIEIDDRGLDESAINSMVRRIDTVKPERSHYALRLFATARASIHHAAAIMAGETVSIRPFQITQATAQPCHAPRLAFGFFSWMTTEIKPQ